jgi:hypothetical protein
MVEKKKKGTTSKKKATKKPELTDLDRLINKVFGIGVRALTFIVKILKILK